MRSAPWSGSGLRHREAPLRSAWSQVFEIYLTDEQVEFLRIAVELCERRADTSAGVEWVQASAVVARLGLDWADIPTMSGPRYVLIGVSDNGTEYSDAPADLTRERIEQILQACSTCAPHQSPARDCPYYD